MCARMIDLKDKQVVSLKDGAVIGFLSDAEINTLSGKIVSIIVSCKGRGMGLFARNDEYVIPWESIEVIGNDSILVNFEIPHHPERKRKNVISGIFYND